jgi:hypothetical protein
VALSLEQLALDHAHERGARRVLADADAGEHLDEAAGEHGEVAIEHVLGEQREDQRLRAGRGLRIWTIRRRSFGLLRWQSGTLQPARLPQLRHF